MGATSAQFTASCGLLKLQHSSNEPASLAGERHRGGPTPALRLGGEGFSWFATQLRVRETHNALGHHRQAHHLQRNILVARGEKGGW